MSDVVLHNKLPQAIAVTILDDTGAPIELRLGAHKKSASIPVERIHAHAYEMASRGHIRIRPVA